MQWGSVMNVFQTQEKTGKAQLFLSYDLTKQQMLY